MRGSTICRQLTKCKLLLFVLAYLTFYSKFAESSRFKFGPSWIVSDVNHPSLPISVNCPALHCASSSIRCVVVRQKFKRCSNNSLSKLYICTLLILLSSDVETNPGPISKFPCGSCSKAVKWNQRAVCCDACNKWHHIDCQNINSVDYKNLQISTHLNWICWSCLMPNFESCLFSNSSIDNCVTSNMFQPLIDLVDHDSSYISQPLATSTPCSKLLHSRKDVSCSQSKCDSNLSEKKDARFNKSKINNLVVLNVNCRSIKNKIPEFANMIASTKADIIIGTESWLSPDVSDSEVFPPNLQIFRRDRVSGPGGGVFIAVSNKFVVSHQPDLETDCEILWIKLETFGSKSTFIGAFYRPSVSDMDSLTKLDASLCRLNTTSSNIWLAGDFNFPGINWETGLITPNCNYLHLHEIFLDCLNEHHLFQIVKFKTRLANTLDLFLTNNESLIVKCDTIPSLSNSDHDVILIEAQIKPVHNRLINKPKPLYNKTNWDAFRIEFDSFTKLFSKLDSDSHSVNDLWLLFKDKLKYLTTKYVPYKAFNIKNKLPWITKDIRLLINKRDKLHIRIKKGNDSLRHKFVKLKSLIKKNIRNSYWSYINSIISYTENQSPAEVKSNNKRFWSFIKRKRQNNVGIAPLKEGGIVYNDAKDKANILNFKFKSSFSALIPMKLKYLCLSSCLNSFAPYISQNLSPLPDIVITINGISKLLYKLNPFKAHGPDQIQPRILKELHIQIAPILQVIFSKSLITGEIPIDWKNANVTPIYKKGAKSDPNNYRPISLTCICSKIMEHIIVSNIMNYADRNKILTSKQHGFRSKLSCETQLLSLIQELHENLNNGSQTDLIFLDFAKAFDKVSHNRLLYKLFKYGIQGQTNNWIKCFLHGRSQQVLVDNEMSDSVPVLSGVPQGSVLGPCLFLFFINDLPDSLSSSSRLFADDVVLYRKIKSQFDIDALQSDLTSLDLWAQDWQMEFNVSKCQVLSVSNRHCLFNSSYVLNNAILENVDSFKYLGITITKDLKWNKHISAACARASGVLRFVARNLQIPSRIIKERAYMSLVRPHVEFCSSVWDPHTQQLQHKLEMVQRRAARFVTGRYHNKSSVSNMINDLNWKSLQSRRRDARLLMFFKMEHSLVDINFKHQLQSQTVSLRHGNNFSYHIPNSNIDSHLFSYLPQTIRNWNSLPDSLVSCSSLDVFRRDLQKI